jgi:competence protein ComEA
MLNSPSGSSTASRCWSGGRTRSAPGGCRRAGGGPARPQRGRRRTSTRCPGIGPVLAQRIVDWRTENGRFASVDQLREVTGIGEAKYPDLRAKVTV